MIDPKLKRALGQAAKGVEVVAATHDGVTRAYTSHWVSQISFEEPIVMASVSPKHDTYPLMLATPEPGGGLRETLVVEQKAFACRNQLPYRRDSRNINCFVRLPYDDIEQLGGAARHVVDVEMLSSDDKIVNR